MNERHPVIEDPAIEPYEGLHIYGLAQELGRAEFYGDDERARVLSEVLEEEVQKGMYREFKQHGVLTYEIEGEQHDNLTAVRRIAADMVYAEYMGLEQEQAQHDVENDPDEPDLAPGPTDPGEAPTEPMPIAAPSFAFMDEMPRELANDLEAAHDEYTTLAAQRGRFSITPRKTRERVEAARQRYEAARLKTQQWCLERINELDLSDEEKNDRLCILDEQFADEAGGEIRDKVINLAEPKGFLAGARKWYYKHWAQHGGGGDKILQ